MGIEIAALKAATVEADSRAKLWQAQGRHDVAEAIYETLLLTLNALLGAEEEQLRGWQRAALLITDPRARLAVDALGVARLDELQMRVSTLLDLPDVTVLTSMQDIHDALSAAIRVGASRYNAGDIWGCCTVYWGTIQSLLGAAVARGFPGYARALAQLRPISEAEPPTLPLDASRADEYAWTLRHALDATLRVTG